MQTRLVPGSLADLHHRFHGDSPGLHEMYRTPHTQCPVLHDQEAGCWLVLRCGDVGSVLTHPDTFTASRSGASPKRPPGSVAGIVQRQFLFRDGEQHLAVHEVLRKPLGRMASQLGCTGDFLRKSPKKEDTVRNMHVHALLCLAEASRLGYPFQYLCADDELHPYRFLFIHRTGKLFHLALFPLLLERIS